eukprot:g12551.t1
MGSRPKTQTGAGGSGKGVATSAAMNISAAGFWAIIGVVVGLALIGICFGVNVYFTRNKYQPHQDVHPDSESPRSQNERLPNYAITSDHFATDPSVSARSTAAVGGGQVEVSYMDGSKRVKSRS